MECGPGHSKGGEKSGDGAESVEDGEGTGDDKVRSYSVGCSAHFHCYCVY